MNLYELTTAKLDQYTKAADADYEKAKAAGDYKKSLKRATGMMKASGKKIDNDVKALQKARGVAEGLDEAVGGNYLYHATGAAGLKGILQSGTIRAANGPQQATQAQTELPTVSVTRDWGYASGSNAVSQDMGIGRDAVLVLDRGAVENKYKTLSTSQSRDIRGTSRANDVTLQKNIKVRNMVVKPGVELKGQHKLSYGTSKAGGEFEEAIPVKNGTLPTQGVMVGFWVNPKSQLMQDSSIMNDPRRLDMVRPNQFVKAKQQQGVAEGGKIALSVQQLATISDEALDKAYGYGRSTPGNSFGWQANLKSAAYAKQMIDKGVTDIEAISDAIHKGWNVTAQAFVKNPDQFSDTEKLKAAGKLEAKLQQRASLMKQNYAQLPDDEQEKDRVVARALLQALTGQPGVAEGSLKEFAPPGSDDSGNDGFSDETLKRLAAEWYNGDEDPRVERTLAAAGWEIGQDEGYDDEPGVFVVQAGDINGNSYMSWPAHELQQGVAEGGFPGAPDVEMPPMKPSGDPQRDKLKQEYVDIHREIKSLVDIPYSSSVSPKQKAQAKARISQLNVRADEIKAILEPRQPPNEWQKKTYGYDDNWNRVGKGVAEEKAGWSDNNGTVKKYEPTKKGPAPSWRLNPDGTATDKNTGITYNRDGSVKSKEGVAEGMFDPINDDDYYEYNVNTKEIVKHISGKHPIASKFNPLQKEWPGRDADHKIIKGLRAKYLKDDVVDEKVSDFIPDPLINKHSIVKGWRKAKGLDEKAPPGDKAERMVKHIKKSYAKDGDLTPKEKSIAYATAWKAHNAGKV